MTHTVILWLDGVRIMDDVASSYAAAKQKADERQQHYMDAHEKKVSDFDRMIEKLP